MLGATRLLCVSLFATSSLFAEESFRVSLDYSPDAKLSDHYRALVRAATQRYRGDIGATWTVTERSILTNIAQPGGLEIKEITGDPFLRHLYVYRIQVSGERELLTEAHLLLDPFPQLALALLLASPK